MLSKVVVPRRAELRVLVEPNAHHLLNIGDAAMLQMALERLRAAFPSSRLEVITDSPERLFALAPEAVPIPALGRELWFNQLWARGYQLLPARTRHLVRLGECYIRRYVPKMWLRLLRVRERCRGGAALRAIDTYVEAIARADLFVVSGAGAVVDEFAPLALTVLEQIETVRRRHARVAMMGQGLGPIDDIQLRRRCARVLPQLDVLGLREGHTGPALLGSLGVVGPTIEMTGDDAVALAIRTRAQELGRALGVSVRRARYARVDDAAQRLVHDALADFVQRRHVPLEPLPISFVPKEDDLSSIAAVLPRGYACTTSRGWVPPSVMAERVARCRVVLTGSYHAAVFALAQGIPVVGLSASPYYDQKFSGLKDLYGAACQKFDVRPDMDGATSRLVEALVEAWEHAPQLRNPALKVSDDLAESSRRLYAKLIPIVES